MSSPKLFDKNLTGSGGKAGLINKDLNPIILPYANSLPPIYPLNKEYISDNSDFYTHVMPFDLFLPEVYNYIQTKPVSALNLDNNVFYNLVPQTGIYVKEKTDKKEEKFLYIYYREEIYIKDEGKTYYHFSFTPGSDADTRLAKFIDIDKHFDDLQTWLLNFNLYKAITNQAEIWDNKDYEYKILQTLKDLLSKYDETDDSTILDIINDSLDFYETKKLSLDAYMDFYVFMSKLKLDSLITDQICNKSMNLLVNNLLFKLQNADLPTFKGKIKPEGRFSDQQKKAIESGSPLTMIQAGAGTGKSTTILGRIKYLVDNGVDPSDIMVLSFTNAAANHIKELNPDVGSMTIAKMIHDIYVHNYPGHKLSNLESMINSIDIFMPADSDASKLQAILRDMNAYKRNAFMRLVSFIDTHTKKTLEILDTIGQTSLEIEIAVAFRQMKSLDYPDELTSRFLIVDEVQDNSIFEFIFMLKYAGVFKQNFYIVGDANQTLYEFRNANPDALQTLEKSKVFKTYQLTTNYRSEPEILEFANFYLKDMDSNKYAKIELSSNKETPITKTSFQDRVRLSPTSYDGYRAQFNNLPDDFVEIVSPYTKKCLDQGQKVTFLAYTNKQTDLAFDVFSELFPNAKIGNISAEKTFFDTVISNFLSKHWNMITVIDPNIAPKIIISYILDNLESLMGRKYHDLSTEITTSLLAKWFGMSKNSIQSWLRDYNRNKLTKEMFYSKLKQSLLDFEITDNACSNMIGGGELEAEKLEIINNSDILVSTIHGTKGLEFDNVILLIKHEDEMRQDEIRLLYVALTRAIHSELIIPYTTTKGYVSQMAKDHTHILNSL